MNQLIIESRWINGRHCPRVHGNLKSALKSAIRSEAKGSQGRTQIILAWSSEDCASGTIIMDTKAVTHAGWAWRGTHPPSWRNREKQAAREWQKICNHLKTVKV
jgi:hypothetical protein